MLEVNKNQAVIGLRPKTQKNGKLERARHTGIIGYSEVVWARRKVRGKLGPKPKSVLNVLKTGDVIYVAPRSLPKKNRRKVQDKHT